MIASDRQRCEGSVAWTFRLPTGARGQGRESQKGPQWICRAGEAGVVDGQYPLRSNYSPTLVSLHHLRAIEMQITGPTLRESDSVGGHESEYLISSQGVLMLWL